MMEPKDYTGKRFGKLIVLGISDKKGKSGHKYYRCLCDCGNEKDISASHLATGASKSCGCGVRLATIKRNTTHGLSKSRLFTKWMNMKSRCSNPNDKAYAYYGGKGIKVCDEWQTNFMAFYDWSMSNGYSDNLTIERIDVNGDYMPNNCKWIPFCDQAKNKSNNRFVEINGTKKLISEWCKESPVSMTTIYQRIRNGWNEIDAITMPDQRKIRKNRKGE